MMLSSNAVHANFIADSIIFDMPFTYPNTEFARKVLNNPDFIEKITQVYAAEGFHYIGASDQGFRTLTCNKEVHSPADLNGITIRTMENKYHMAAWDNLGANPTPLAFNELYTALQQGTVDAQENPIELIYANKFYEQQDYVVNTNHIFQTIVWIMNEEFYQSLPDDLKQVVDGASSEGIAAACQYQDEHLEQFSQEIKNYGTQFVDLTDAQREEFVAATQAVRDMVKADCDAELYEIYMAAVEAAK